MLKDEQVVRNQYATSARLETRISIHEKYSRNKQPFGEWIVSHYHLAPVKPCWKSAAAQAACGKASPCLMHAM